MLVRMSLQSFVVICDYGQGEIGAVVEASEKADVEEIFERPSWRVFSAGEQPNPERPLSEYTLRANLKSPNDWLRSMIFIRDRKREGKTSFPFESERSGSLEYWMVWARTEAEVVGRYPWMSRSYGGWGDLECRLARYCDIDNPGDFLRAQMSD